MTSLFNILYATGGLYMRTDDFLGGEGYVFKVAVIDIKDILPTSGDSYVLNPLTSISKQLGLLKSISSTPNQCSTLE